MRYARSPDQRRSRRAPSNQWAIALVVAATTGACETPDTDGAPAVPAARAHHQLVHHEAEGRTYLIGGSTPRQGGHHYFRDVWTWDGQRWAPAPPLPFARSSHRIAYAPNSASLLLFGGMDGDSVRADGGVWTREAERWQRRSDRPEAGRVEPGTCYDRARDHWVIFGGVDADGGLPDDTWIWNGAELRRVAEEGPGGRLGHAMAWDAAGRRCLLFGGRDATDRVRGDSWSWDGEQWRPLDVGGPPPRWIFTATSDPAGGRVVVFGGQDAEGALLGDTWAWDGAAWSLVATSGPEPRMMGALAYDGTGVLLFGGRAAAEDGYRDLDDSWRLVDARWREVGPLSPP